MKKTLTTAILAVFGLWSFTATADAQFWPGYGYYGGYGAWGAYAAGMENATTRYIAQQDRVAGQQVAAQQMAAMQSGIRNTLSTQAEARTQGLLNQQQSNSDWWFQVQQQQLAQRQALASRSASSKRPAAAAEEAISEQAATEAVPSAETDIIKWPPVLRDQRFAQQRAMVEAPYRRGPAEKAIPTVKDYENMISAAKQMKALLGEMTADISAQGYLHAEKFLDQLADEARQRIERNKK